MASKSRSKFDRDFGMLFCRSTGRGAASWGRRRIVDAPAAQVPVPRIPLGGAPFARGESYKRLGSQAPRPKASLPKASQASQTRSNTQWARGPTNYIFSTNVLWMLQRVFIGIRFLTYFGHLNLVKFQTRKCQNKLNQSGK